MHTWRNNFALILILAGCTSTVPPPPEEPAAPIPVSPPITIYAKPIHIAVPIPCPPGRLMAAPEQLKSEEHSAAAMTVTAVPNKTAKASNGVNTVAVIENYGICHRNMAVLVELQEYVKKYCK